MKFLRTLFLLLVSSVLVNAADCTKTVCVTSINLSWDSSGYADTRPSTWGTTDAFVFPLTFHNVPEGYRVQITRLYGDHQAWLRGPADPGTHAGVLFGIQTTEPDHTAHLGYANDNCFLYHQGSVSNNDFSFPFDHRITKGLLQADHTMLVKIALYLNDTGKSVHQEFTSIVEYKFVQVVPEHGR